MSVYTHVLPLGGEAKSAADESYGCEFDGVNAVGNDRDVRRLLRHLRH